MRIRPRIEPTHRNDSLLIALTAAVGIALLLVAMQAFGADINKGYSWLPNDRVTATKLNNEIDLATINTTFFTDKSSAQPISTDTILFYQGSSGLYRKASYSVFNLGNTNLITDQTEDTSPATNDLHLTYDVSAGTFKNATLANEAIAIKPTVWGNWWSNAVFAVTTNNPTDPTNYYFTQRTAPAGTDSLLIWDSVANTNKWVSLNTFWTNSGVKKIVSSQFPWPGAGAQTNVTHGLGGVPDHVRWVIVCTNTDASSGYAAGDEADIAIMSGTVGNMRNALLPWATSTTCSIQGWDNSWLIENRINGTFINPSSRANFNIKLYASRWQF